MPLATGKLLSPEYRDGHGPSTLQSLDHRERIRVILASVVLSPHLASGRAGREEIREDITQAGRGRRTRFSVLVVVDAFRPE